MKVSFEGIQYPKQNELESYVISRFKNVKSTDDVVNNIINHALAMGYDRDEIRVELLVTITDNVSSNVPYSIRVYAIVKTPHWSKKENVSYDMKSNNLTNYHWSKEINTYGYAAECEKEEVVTNM